MRVGGGGRRVGVLAVVAVLAIGAPVSSAPNAADGDYIVEGCDRADLGGHSVARVWDEALLELIRQVVPAPTVHARNLFHTSAAMWDAWAAYDPDADGFVVTEKPPISGREPMSRPPARRRSATRPTGCCSGATGRCPTSR